MKPSASSTIIIFAIAATASVLAGSHARQTRAVRRAFQAWSIGQGSIYDLMDDDTEIVIPGMAAHCGIYRKEVFLREVAAPFAARFARPPLPQLRKLWASVGTVAVMADAIGTTREGRAYANTYLIVFEMAGRRVKRVIEFLDMVAFNAVWDRVEPAAAQADAF